MWCSGRSGSSIYSAHVATAFCASCNKLDVSVQLGIVSIDSQSRRKYNGNPLSARVFNNVYDFFSFLTFLLFMIREDKNNILQLNCISTKIQMSWYSQISTQSSPPSLEVCKVPDPQLFYSCHGRQLVSLQSQYMHIVCPWPKASHTSELPIRSSGNAVEEQLLAAAKIHPAHPKEIERIRNNQKAPNMRKMPNLFPQPLPPTNFRFISFRSHAENPYLWFISFWSQAET